MRFLQNWTGPAIVVGRIGLASLFLLGALNKVLNYGQVLDQMSREGLPISAVLLPLVIALELFGGLAVAIGRMFVVPAAMALAAFTIGANSIFHDFWNMEGAAAQLELALFFKNVSIAGALLLLAGSSQAGQPS